MSPTATRKPPFRADHVGSLKRPQRLMDARSRLLGVHDFDHNLAAHDNEELARIEDECIREVVALQEEVGLQSVTDGEFRRRTWWTDFVWSIEGLTATMRGEQEAKFVQEGGDELPSPQVAVEDRVRWLRSVVAGPFSFLRETTSRTAKVTIPAPSVVSWSFGKLVLSPDAYDDVDAFHDDLVAAYRQEIQALADAGCEYLQLDDVSIPMLCDESYREMVRGQGRDPDKLVETYVDLCNRAIAERPESMTVTLHQCRGNMSGHWAASGAYDPVAEALLGGMDVDGFFLEYDSERAGGFEPLRHLAPGKTAVLGLVTTKSPELEDPDELKRSIEKATAYAPLEQLALSPQCGFSSNWQGNPVTIDDERRKLALIVEVADQVWNGS
jgi:5-methyltetrahydropteroyltriglutamate--homocysteine methyltransferase